MSKALDLRLPFCQTFTANASFLAQPYSAPTTYPAHGPLHRLLSRLMTEENVAKLGFVEWSKTKGLIERAFEQDDPLAMRYAFAIAQWVVIGQRFGVEAAKLRRR